MHDHSLAVILGLIAAAITFMCARAKPNPLSRQRHNDAKADAKADKQTAAAEQHYEEAQAAAASQTQAIDRASIDVLKDMVNHEYGSD